MKKIGVISCMFLVIFVLLSSVNYAANETVQTFSKDVAYSWLLNESQKDTISIQDLAVSILSLNNEAKYNIGKQVKMLSDRGDLEAQCWPAGACNLVDTAYAILALRASGQDVTKGISWLKTYSVVSSADIAKWQLVIDSKSNGSCKIGVGDKTKDFILKDNKIGDKYYISLADIFGVNQKLATLSYDCSGLGAGAEVVASLNFEKSQTEKFIISGGKDISGSIAVPNACFPQAPGKAGCDYDTTLFVSWALAEMAESADGVGTYVYLQTNYPSSPKDIQLSFLARYLQAAVMNGANLIASYYTNSLASKQTGDGGFGGSVYTTSVAVFALAPSSDKSEYVSKGKTYLESKWKANSMWGGIRDSAWALIALSDKTSFGISSIVISGVNETPAGGSVEIDCTDGIDNDGDAFTDCDDIIDCANTDYCKYCRNGVLDAGEESTDCGGICPPCGIPSYNKTGAVSYEIGFVFCSDKLDNDNDGWTDCDDPDCATESNCIAKGKTDNVSIASSTKKEEESSLVWLWILIVLVLIGGGVYFYFGYIKSGKFKFGGGKGPSFEEFKRQRVDIQSRPVAAQKPSLQSDNFSRKPLREKEEDELEASLKKAAKLLHGK